MSEAQWTQAEFEAAARRHIAAGLAAPEQFQRSLASFFKEAMEHYENATAEGQAYLEQMVARMGGFFQGVLESAPDNAENRKARRILAAVQGEHFHAEALFDSFHALPEEPDEEVQEAVTVLTRTTQGLLDVLHDAIQRSQKGPANFAITGLFFWLIDETMAAQFLARRSHATLAYTHLRSIMEISDKIELFTKQPEQAEIWIAGNEREVWKKLAPPRVREKLGRSSFDPLYQYFSEQGSHSTFTAMQSRVRRRSNTGNQRLGITMMIGGIPDRGRQLSILMYATLLTNIALHRAVFAFAERLNGEDAAQIITSSNEACFGLIERIFSLAKELPMDLSPLDTFRKAWEKTKDAIEEALKETR